MLHEKLEKAKSIVRALTGFSPDLTGVEFEQLFDRDKLAAIRFDYESRVVKAILYTPNVSVHSLVHELIHVVQVQTGKFPLLEKFVPHLIEEADKLFEDDLQRTLYLMEVEAYFYTYSTPGLKNRLLKLIPNFVLEKQAKSLYKSAKLFDIPQIGLVKYTYALAQIRGLQLAKRFKLPVPKV